MFKSDELREAFLQACVKVNAPLADARVLEALSKTEIKDTKMAKATIKKELTLEQMLAMYIGQEVESGCMRIKRAPGGWVYTRIHPNAGVHSLFVTESAVVAQ